jgi:trans-aconitate methyltransferase
MNKINVTEGKNMIKLTTTQKIIKWSKAYRVRPISHVLADTGVSRQTFLKQMKQLKKKKLIKDYILEKSGKGERIIFLGA